MRVPGIPYVQGRNDNGSMDPSGVAIHCTDNDAPAEGEAGYATRRTDGVGAHLYADHDSVVQSIDTGRRTGHAGSGNGNRNSIAVEITGRVSASRRWWLDNVAWDRLAAALAVVCRTHRIEPRRASVAEMRDNPRVRAFYGHDDMRQAWGGTTHTDPGPNFPWDHLLATVRRALDGHTTEDDMPLTKADEPVIKRAVHDTPIGQTGVTIAQVLDPLRHAPGKLDKIVALQQALLAAQQGLDTRAVLARIDEHAQAERRRDEATARSLAELPARILDALPAGDGPVSRDDLEAALRAVLGSVDEA